MRNLFIVLLFGAMPFQAFAAHELPADVAGFLSTRRVLATISFNYGSATLTSAARANLIEVAGRLRETETDKYIVRIEGFASSDGDNEKNLYLSMDRARSVESFLETIEGLGSTRTLMGMGVDQWSDLSPDQQRRAEVAVYENRFNGNDWRTDAYLFD